MIGRDCPCLQLTGPYGTTSTAKGEVSAGDAKDKGRKQGAYGKVVIHKHSKFNELIRVHEVTSALQVRREKTCSFLQIESLFYNHILGCAILRLHSPPTHPRLTVPTCVVWVVIFWK